MSHLMSRQSHPLDSCPMHIYHADIMYVILQQSYFCYHTKRESINLSKEKKKKNWSGGSYMILWQVAQIGKYN